MSKAKGKSAKKTVYNNGGAVELFSLLADPENPDIATMEGIFKLGELLEIDASADVRILSILWKFGAISKPGCITKAEFLAGMESNFITDIKGLKDSLYTFDTGFLEASEFREFYKFVFQFSREGTNKTLGYP